jgi:glycosyltransferase involved in cell wall biosynthesis
MRLEAEFHRLGMQTTYDPASRPLDAVLVFAGTRNLGLLRRCRRENIRVVQRLDAINWLHRVSPRPIRHFLRAEAFNLLLRAIRFFLADRVIYQSQFARRWWESWYGVPRAEARIIYNGVPLEEYPARNGPHDGSLLVVEGHLPHDGYLRAVLETANRQLVKKGALKRMQVVGSADSAWEGEWARFDPPPEVAGVQPYAEVQTRQAQAAVYLSLDVNAACPNAVVEAMASGLPVIGFDTGSMKELVGRGGEAVEFEGNPWRLEIPRNLDAIGDAGRQVLARWDVYSQNARQEAESKFDIRATARAYLEAMEG